MHIQMTIAVGCYQDSPVWKRRAGKRAIATLLSALGLEIAREVLLYMAYEL